MWLRLKRSVYIPPLQPINTTHFGTEAKILSLIIFLVPLSRRKTKKGKSKCVHFTCYAKCKHDDDDGPTQGKSVCRNFYLQAHEQKTPIFARCSSDVVYVRNTLFLSAAS